MPLNTPPVPLDLPRLVLRRAAGVAALVMAVAVALGGLRLNQDIDSEVDAAMALAAVMAAAGNLAHTADDAALAALRRAQADAPLRHLLLQVHDADGHLLLQPPPEPPAPWWLRGPLALHRELLSPPDRRRVSWAVPRPAGPPWTLSLAASHESERREAMVNFLGTLVLLAMCTGALLLATRWHLRRAFAPLGRLLGAMAGIEQHDTRAVRALPAMPIRELEVLAAGLRHLAGALDEAEAQRRLLSQQVLTLQEDERARLARELHDEFGQRLTALRVDAAWLARRAADTPALQGPVQQVIDGMATQCQQIQQDIRGLLGRLQPFGHGLPTAPDDGAAGQPLARLVALLHSLMAGWQAPGRDGLAALRLDLQWTDGDSRPQPWPEPAQAEALALPAALALTLYRISQESLTNIARHAQAGQATLRLAVRGACRPGSAWQIDWSVADDGIGLPAHATDAASRRGNGLAGLRERVWAQGGDLQLAAAQPGAARPGLRLSATFHTTALAVAEPAWPVAA
jgi:two-component system sensor histidine kinase UhpB